MLSGEFLCCKLEVFFSRVWQSCVMSNKTVEQRCPTLPLPSERTIGRRNVIERVSLTLPCYICRGDVKFSIANGKAFFRTLLGWPSESHLFWFGRCGGVFIVLCPLGCTSISRRTAARVTWAVLHDRRARDSRGVYRVADMLMRETSRAARHRMRFRVAWHGFLKTNPMGYGAWCVVRIVELISLMLRR